MLITDAQREMRSTYLGGSVGQAVSGIIWLVSAALGVWSTPTAAILALVFGGVFIFPLTQLALRLLGRKASVSKGNALNGLAMQVAFTLPLAIPVILAAAADARAWFYPGFMIILGAHYLPFIFLYGMRHFAVLAAVLIGAGAFLGMAQPAGLPWTAGAWFTGVVLLLFAGMVWATKPYQK